MEWVRIFENKLDALRRLTQNRPQLLIVGERRICLFLKGDELLAVEDRCPHNGESLSKGQINYLGEIICPWHGYRFNLQTGREGGERCRDLVVYPIRESVDGVFIGL